MDNQKEHLDYLFRSLQHHPSPYLIYELDGSLKWSNLAARYIFRMDNLKDLSMGMSSDFEEAIINGSTYLRLGTKILGERISIL